MSIGRDNTNKIRVLVIDDSAFFRHRITNILSADDRIEVVGTAGDGKAGVSEAIRLRPDVITMDVEMPVMDGITAVKQIMSEAPTSIMMLSSHTSEGAKATLDALNAGALDFIPKQIDSSPDAREKLAKKLVNRVLAMGRKKLLTSSSSPVSPVRREAQRRNYHDSQLTAKKGSYKLVVVGASTGGPVAIQQLICSLPSSFSVPMVLVVHMPASFTTAYAERLNSLSKLNVKEAENGDLLMPGQILLAPGGRQLSFSQNGKDLSVYIRDGAAEDTYKPCIDFTFESAAQMLHDSVLAVVLTGMGADGSHGASILKRCDSTVWSQDEASCVIYGMPQAVEKKGLSDLVLPLDEIGPTMVKAV